MYGLNVNGLAVDCSKNRTIAICLNGWLELLAVTQVFINMSQALWDTPEHGNDIS